MKHFNTVRKYLMPAFTVGTAVLLAPAAFAAGPDYSVISDAVDFSAIDDVVLSVAAALAGIYVIIKGVRIAMSFVKGG